MYICIYIVQFLLISMLGFLSTMQITTDFAEMMTAMNAAVSFPDQLTADLNTSFIGINAGATKFLERANDWTAGFYLFT